MRLSTATLFAGAMLAAGEALTGHAQYTVPLTLALDSAASHRSDLEKTGAAQRVFEQIVRDAFT